MSQQRSLNGGVGDLKLVKGLILCRLVFKTFHGKQEQLESVGCGLELRCGLHLLGCWVFFVCLLLFCLFFWCFFFFFFFFGGGGGGGVYLI